MLWWLIVEYSIFHSNDTEALILDPLKGIVHHFSLCKLDEKIKN